MVFENAFSLFNQDSRIVFLGDDLDVSGEVALAITMTAHELATNAIKYGSLSNTSGRVGINSIVNGDKFQLVWKEFSGPPVKKPERTGFGTKMIERLLAAAVKGSVDIAYERDGLRSTLQANLKGLN
ncbi:hypothetical protein [Ochrobactrum sp. MYb379]|uniref:hypothetical protein n=1 Tax=Ochrobactrum sp. MYb379 TaxID=2745275 RepID=UPI00309C6D1B